MDTANDVISLVLGVLMILLGSVALGYGFTLWRQLRRRDINR